MDKELKDLIIKYITRVGENAAMKNAVVGIESLIEIREEDGVITKDILSALAFKMALIEYFYFHEDKDELALKLAKKLK